MKSKRTKLRTEFSRGVKIGRDAPIMAKPKYDVAISISGPSLTLACSAVAIASSADKRRQGDNFTVAALLFVSIRHC